MRSLTNISPRPQGTMTLVEPKHTVTFIVVWSHHQYFCANARQSTERQACDVLDGQTVINDITVPADDREILGLWTLHFT